MRRFLHQSQILGIATGLWLASNIPQPASAAWPVEECDRLAAHPFDPEKPPGVEGVRLKQIDVSRASEACSTALRLEPGNVRMQFQLGRVFYTAKQPEKAFRYMFSAADRGYLVAFHNIGTLFYYGGPGFPASQSDALRWYEKSARFGLDESKRSAAEMLEAGEGVAAPSPERAAVYWRSLAAKGDIKARERLRNAYNEPKYAAPPVFTPVPETPPPEKSPIQADKTPESSELSPGAKIAIGGVAVGLCAYSEICRNLVGDIVRDAIVQKGSEALRGKSN